VNAEMRIPTAAAELERLQTSTDSFSVNDRGVLEIEGCDAEELVAKYGSPIYVFSEQTIRANYRRIRDSLSACWSSDTRVLYAIKANNNLAIRAILSGEGAGGDCFGIGEMHATLAGGTDPAFVVLNGSNKSSAELLAAVRAGVLVFIDSLEEISLLEDVSRATGRRPRVGIRLRPNDDWGSTLLGDFYPDENRSSIAKVLRDNKWGFGPSSASTALERLLSTDDFDVVGFHFHVGRLSRALDFYRAWSVALGDVIVDLNRRTGYWPEIVDIGGGWLRERDTESQREERWSGHSIEEYLAVVGDNLRRAFSRVDRELPGLWIEPGRYIVGNAGTLLTTVGTVKREDGRTWVNIDASTNDLMRIEVQGLRYPLLPATEMYRPYSETVDVVGPTCLHSVLARDVRLPELARGDLMVALDAGMYAETGSTQFNGVPRPASVLVAGGQAELIKKRETVEEVFANHLIPARLLEAIDMSYGGSLDASFVSERSRDALQ
jgi:diaminopimelate decarboxylase